MFSGEHLRGLMFQTVFHARLSGGGYSAEMRAVEFPELVVTRHAAARRDPCVRRAFVGDVEIPWGEWDRAAAEIHAARHRPDDADEPCLEEI